MQPSKPVTALPQTGLTSALNLHGTRDTGFAIDNPLRILIAEDNPMNRRVFMLFLKHLGYEPDSVQDGLECLDAALVTPYDLILTDIDMPRMNGLRCTSELRRAGIKTSIIAVSASPRANIAAECRAAGMDGYLPKPVPPEVMRSTLHEVYFNKIGRAAELKQRLTFPPGA
jgi:CheY-like chemotaxis protein